MVTSNGRCPMIETLHEPKLNQFLEDNEEAEIWLQKDGATHTAHTSWRSVGILRVVSSASSLFARRHIRPHPREVT
ncbi:hypothetical protein TNCV_3440001 [Trichonephila clavipes]|uniref:Uncharacterized protein n=1 Tax=Trichonephila clavipes TaxID=2585209 RepID=A0A8X6W5J1_TRICX|nr:hypothetical protein TNCV_3440001 [Trichonephila clavipes]